jgi:ATP-dependent Clp protease ATP-binding subunit ClpC
MKERILGHVKELFSPELVNRIDDSIVFHQLSESNVYEIIDLQISDLIENLSKLGLKLKLNKSAKKYIANKGYDPKYGVRLLRREIQKTLEDPISEMLLKNAYSKGTVIIVKVQKGQIVFSYNAAKRPSKKIS